MIAFDFIKRDLKNVEECDLLITYFHRLFAGTYNGYFMRSLKARRLYVFVKLKIQAPMDNISFRHSLKEG